MEAPELGVSLRAPAGWQVDRRDSRLSSKGYGIGLIIDEPLEGRAFEETARQLPLDFGSRTISGQRHSVDGYDAFTAVVEHPNAGSKSIRTYINKNGTLIEVSFVTLLEDFDNEAEAIADSLASIKIE